MLLIASVISSTVFCFVEVVSKLPRPFAASSPLLAQWNTNGGGTEEHLKIESIRSFLPVTF
jgi:hypothetical protein